MIVEKHITWTMIDNERLVLFNSQNKKCLVIEGTGIDIWNIIQDFSDKEEVKNNCKKIFEDTGSIDVDIDDFFDLLIEYGIICQED